MRSIVQTLAAAGLLVSSAPAAAHQLSCEKSAGLVRLDLSAARVFDGEGLPVLDGESQVLVVDRYPAAIGFRVRVENEAPDTSVVTGAWDSLLAGLTGVTWYGTAIAPGLALLVDGVAVAVAVVPLPDREACLALGGLAAAPPAEPAGPVCRADALENRFVVSHDSGSAECRARIVCAEAAPPRPPSATWFATLDAEAAVGARVLGDAVLHVAGRVNRGEPEWWDLFVATFLADGTQTGFASKVSATRNQNAFDAVFDEGGNAYVASHASASGLGLISKVAPDGTVLWETIAQDPSLYDGSTAAIALDPTGGVVAVSHYHGPTSTDASVRKIGPGGEIVWTTTFAGPVYDAAEAAAVDAAGNVFLVGSFGDVPGTFDLAKLDASGAVLWTRAIRSGFGAYDLAIGEGGSLFVFARDTREPWLRRFDSDGNEDWSVDALLGTYEASTGSIAVEGDQVWLGASVYTGAGYETRIVLLDAATGERRWDSVLAGREPYDSAIVRGVAGDPRGWVYVVGEMANVSPVSTVTRAFVARLDPP